MDDQQLIIYLPTFINMLKISRPNNCSFIVWDTTLILFGHASSSPKLALSLDDEEITGFGIKFVGIIVSLSKQD